MNNVHLAKVFVIVCLLVICIFVHLKVIICCELCCRANLLNMSKRVKACCVLGCTNKQAIRHSIPTNEDVCRIWLQRINNPKLIIADTVLSSHRICGIHFEPICRNPNGRFKNFHCQLYIYLVSTYIYCDNKPLMNPSEKLCRGKELLFPPIVNVPIYKPFNRSSKYTGLDLVTPYVAGSVAKKLFKSLKCHLCKNIILSL
ncbi:uncharacterized protein LOC130898108 [Diorhabda carinulata]|uniref:uncharacterized protein LOC130898108 n=1 Tax=Diorhabda carinulata TaxID=1163345 RepID=UPI0025A2311C|nr:uncharacterized protein LOC130898108 [Diorhabda carinulata]